MTLNRLQRSKGLIVLDLINIYQQHFCIHSLTQLMQIYQLHIHYVNLTLSTSQRRSLRLRSGGSGGHLSTQ